MKKKANGVYHAQIAARKYEQKAGKYYNENSIAAPVINKASIFLVLNLLVMGQRSISEHCLWDGEKIYIDIPKGFMKYYPIGFDLFLLKTLYGLKQSPFEYWMVLLEVLQKAKLKQSKANPCAYHKWRDKGLSIWTSWVEDLLTVSPKEGITANKATMMKHFELDQPGKLSEYIGC